MGTKRGLRLRNNRKLDFGTSNILEKIAEAKVDSECYGYSDPFTTYGIPSSVTTSLCRTTSCFQEGERARRVCVSVNLPANQLIRRKV